MNGKILDCGALRAATWVLALPHPPWEPPEVVAVDKDTALMR